MYQKGGASTTPLTGPRPITWGTQEVSTMEMGGKTTSVTLNTTHGHAEGLFWDANAASHAYWEGVSHIGIWENIWHRGQILCHGVICRGRVSVKYFMLVPCGSITHDGGWVIIVVHDFPLTIFRAETGGVTHCFQCTIFHSRFSGRKQGGGALRGLLSDRGVTAV